jgi:hypothetical protein
MSFSRALRGIAPGDSVGGLEDRHLHDGHHSHGDGRGGMAGGDLGGPIVRLGDDVSLRDRCDGEERGDQESEPCTAVKTEHRVLL